MHAHDHDGAERESLRPKSRIDETPDNTLFRAAVAGRTDIVGAGGMLRLQRAVGNGAVHRLAGEQENPVGSILAKGSGMPFDGPARADMEARFGTDFSNVRIHTGEDAHASAKAVNAHAYTVGSNIVFQRGTFDPDSSAGRTMLAHELTHVVQQRSGPVDGTPTGRGFKVSDPSDRFEREAAANAERIVGLPVPTPASPAVASSVPSSSAAGAVQRDDDLVQRFFEKASGPGPAVTVQREGEDEDEVQGSFEAGAAVQREGEEEQQED